MYCLDRILRAYRYGGTKRYEQRAFGSGVEFHYLPFNLMDYEREELEADANPMALVVLAAQERERLRQEGDRFNTKWYLIRRLYERGYNRAEIIALFRFIDWVIRLSTDEEIRLRDAVKALEEVNKMPYVTSVERIGREEGLQQGLQQALLDALAEKFGHPPETVSDAIHQIQDTAQLRLLILQVIRCESLAEFQCSLNGN